MAAGGSAHVLGRDAGLVRDFAIRNAAEHVAVGSSFEMRRRGPACEPRGARFWVALREPAPRRTPTSVGAALETRARLELDVVPLAVEAHALDGHARSRGDFLVGIFPITERNSSSLERFAVARAAAPLPPRVPAFFGGRPGFLPAALRRGRARVLRAGGMPRLRR
jgi:hypothetical protein